MGESPTIDPNAGAAKKSETQARSSMLRSHGGPGLGNAAQREFSGAVMPDWLKTWENVSPMTCAAPVWNYNIAITGGQSFAMGTEGWPSLATTGPEGALMIGACVRPQQQTAAKCNPLGDNILRPVRSATQDLRTGAILDAQTQAALPPGSPNNGEEVGIAATSFARQLFLETQGLAQDPSRQFVTFNVAVGSRTVEEWQKGAPFELFNRLRNMTSAVKEAVAALGEGNTVGISVVRDLQGESNYDPKFGGTSEKDRYKELKLQYYNDLVADCCRGILGQSELPAVFTYQTSGRWLKDSADMSISMAQIELMLENPNWFLVAPSYAVVGKGGHLDPNGYRWLGCQFGKVEHIVTVLRKNWRPLYPVRITRSRRDVVIDFHAPCPPLQFQPVWNGAQTKYLRATLYKDRGFSVTDDGGTIPLDGVEIVGDAAVRLTLGRDVIGTQPNVYYARETPFGGTGNLCDSDPTVAPYDYTYTPESGQYAVADLPSLNGKPYPLWNWCVAFKMAAVGD